MTKKEFLEINNIKIRVATAEDNKNGETDYQRMANYIIVMPTGNEYYNKNYPTIKDLEEVYKIDKKEEVIKNRNICYEIQGKYNMSIEDLRKLSNASFIGWYY